MPFNYFLPLREVAVATTQVCPELSSLQIAAGFVSWLGFLQVLAIVGAVVCVGILLKTWFSWILVMFATIPVELYEGLGYLAAFALIGAGYWADPINLTWFILSGSLLLAAMLAITGAIHNLETNAARYFGILFVVWTGVALFYQSQVVGFLAVGAFMGMLGFSAALIPMGYAIGFESGSVVRATFAAFVVMAASILWHLSGTTLSNPLQEGALWFGPFVLYLGLLIIASRYYSRTDYAVRQILPLILGFAGIGMGMVFGVPHLAGIAGTFFVLYLIEKAFDIPVHSLTGYATIGLFVSVLLGLAVWWAQNHMELVQPFLLF